MADSAGGNGSNQNQTAVNPQDSKKNLNGNTLLPDKKNPQIPVPGQVRRRRRRRRRKPGQAGLGTKQTSSDSSFQKPSQAKGVSLNGNFSKPHIQPKPKMEPLAEIKADLVPQVSPPENVVAPEDISVQENTASEENIVSQENAVLQGNNVTEKNSESEENIFPPEDTSSPVNILPETSVSDSASDNDLLAVSSDEPHQVQYESYSPWGLPFFEQAKAESLETVVQSDSMIEGNVSSQFEPEVDVQTDIPVSPDTELQTPVQNEPSIFPDSEAVQDLPAQSDIKDSATIVQPVFSSESQLTSSENAPPLPEEPLKSEQKPVLDSIESENSSVESQNVVARPDFIDVQAEHADEKDQEGLDVQNSQLPSAEKDKASKESLDEMHKWDFQKSIKTIFTNLLSVFKDIFHKFQGLGQGGFVWNILKNCLLFILVISLFYAGYAFRLHETIYKYVSNLLNPPKPPPIQVVIDDQILQVSGIRSLFLFSKNQGSVQDAVYPPLKSSFYFGTLSEPKYDGDTGISASYHFGKLLDLKTESSLFISYIENLTKLQELYRIDVYAMLDQTTDRAKKLLDYIDSLTQAREASATILREILTEIDDLKISFNSLDGERKTFEQDFFGALASLAGERSDFLLKNFVDIAQKESTIKARLGALQKLTEYYQNALKSLDLRIKVVQSNKDALIQGIHVIKIPGDNLNIIIPGTAP